MSCVGCLRCLCFVHSSRLWFHFRERNNFLLSTSACLHMLCSEGAAGPPSLYQRNTAASKPPAGRLSLMPTGSSQRFPQCACSWATCIALLSGEFRMQMPGCSHERWPLFTYHLLPSCSLVRAAVQQSKQNAKKKKKNLCSYTKCDAAM